MEHLVEYNCPACGERWHIILTEDEYQSLVDYRAGNGLIQNLLATLNPCEREFIKTNYCPKCQEEIFGDGQTERIKKNEL